MHQKGSLLFHKILANYYKQVNAKERENRNPDGALLESPSSPALGQKSWNTL
jgi:hypothetical protein